MRPITESENRIAFAVQVEDALLVDGDTAFSLGVVLTELITNAVKYAFPPPRTGTILAEARRRSDRVEVMIQDDGIGISHFRQGSLGYGLVRSLVQQIRGEMDIRNDPGLTVTIMFPNHVEAEQ